MNRSRGFRALLLGIGMAIAGVELTSYVGLWAIDRVLDEGVWTSRRILADQVESIDQLLEPDRREVLDEGLGWRYARKPRVSGVNAQGVRSEYPYDVESEKGTMRVAAFGDSFVYGNEVEDNETWSHLIEVTDDGLEVLNYGVGGYGTDQAFLRYLKDADELRPDLVILGFTPVSLRRIENRYRRFISHWEWPLSKPRFLLDNGRLVLLPPGLPDEASLRRLRNDPGSVTLLGDHDRWYDAVVYENPLHDWSATVRLGNAVLRRIGDRVVDPNRLLRGELFNAESSAFKLQVAVMQAFADSARARGHEPVILILPDRQSLARATVGSPAVYDPLAKTLEARGLRVLDATRALLPSENLESIFAPYGHYSPRGNARIAAWLAPLLKEIGRSGNVAARRGTDATQVPQASLLGDSAQQENPP